MALTIPKWLTPEMVQASLQTSKFGEKVRIHKYQIESATKPGDGHSSQMYRARLELVSNNKIQPLNLIIKAQLENKSKEYMESGKKVFEVEMNMLNETLPKLQNLLNLVLDEPLDRLYPECYFCRDTPIALIIEEDLCEQGYVTPKNKKMDASHCVVVMKILAKLHAASFAAIQSNPNVVQKYETPFWDATHDHFITPLVTSSINILIKYMSTWQNFPKRLVAKLQNISHTSVKTLYKVYKRDDKLINVLIHGDAWVNNLMVKYEDLDIVGLKLVDFQLTCCNSPVLDLVYFLFSSVECDIRNSLLDSFLKTYHSHLVEVCRLLNAGMDYSFDEFMKDFQSKLFFGLMTLIVIYPLTVPVDDGVNVSELCSNPDSYRNDAVFNNLDFRQNIEKTLLYFESVNIL